MQAGILDREEHEKDKKTILRKEKAKKKEKKKLVDIRKIKEKEMLRKLQ